MILACLTDDVVWDLPGHAHLEGIEAFDAEIEGAGFQGDPTLTVDRVLEDGDTVVTLGEGAAPRPGAEPFRFSFCDVFTFRGDRICRVESYLAPLGDAGG